MRIEAFDPAAEPEKVAACWRMYAAGRPFDDPGGPPPVEKIFTAWMRQGFAGQPREAALALAADGQPVGFYLLELSQRENPHNGDLLPVVAPDQRRRGYGTALLRHAAARAKAHGRTLLSAEIRSDSPGSAFAAATGASAGVLEIRRVLDVTAIPPGHLAALRRRSEPAAPGYELLSWVGPTPEEHVNGVAEVRAAMADAPRNPGEEPDRPDPERLRISGRRLAGMGIRVYSVVARCDRTGELAGQTTVAIDNPGDVWAHQQITVVARGHRGHRLGLLMKLEMMERLLAAEPQVTRIITANADSNQYMISINEALGYRELDGMQSWELPVSGLDADSA
jgi:GNAT superfamily N-acetyltransferase